MGSFLVESKTDNEIKSIIKESQAAPDGSVEVNVSYDIIRHVSAQLYTNPRKAIEELICNSYDAGAKLCYVTLPRDSKRSLLVLDNGKSMDLEGLQKLWKVADSPKNTFGNDRIEDSRMQIGKFGVGKLAAFALGKRLTHIVCINDEVRVVSVGQMEIKEREGGKPPTFAVYKMPLNQAILSLKSLFSYLPKPWEKGWKTWTLAVVQEIDTQAAGRALMINILRRMITNALPISADFKVFVEGNEVPKRVIKEEDIEVKVDVTNPDLRKSIRTELQALWFDILEKQQPGMKIEDVPQEKFTLTVERVSDPQKITQHVNALIVPELGPVIGYAVITKNSLTTDKLTERGYSNNGFAIRVHGKLINPEDELFGISARSHAYWSRFFADLEIPGLDNVLLVQRNDISENTNEAQIARAVAKVLFNFTRVKDDDLKKDVKYVPESFGSRLRILSPMVAPIALSGLVESVLPEKGLESIDVDFSSLGENGPAVRYDDIEKKIFVNEDHPLIEALDELGQSSKSDLRHVIGEVLAGTELAKGYLRSQGVQERIVKDTADIIEVSVRSAAQFVVDAVEVHIKDILDASYEGGARFENAVVSAFRNLRLSATHYGASDEPDGIIEIPVSGAPNLLISVEAKGSKGVITHKQLSEATVTRHSEEFNCKNAIAIAREFSVDGIDGKDSALIRETRGIVPLITTSGLSLILKLHKKRPFTYDKIIKILTTWTPPNELEEFIKKTWAEMPELGLMRLILEVALEQMQKDDTNLPEPGMILADERIRQRKLKKGDLINILQTIQITTSMIIVDPGQGYQFKLLQDCDTILRALEKDPFEDKPPAGTLLSFENKK